MKNIYKYLNESKEITYRVCLIGVIDKEDLPINVSITIDSENQKEFEEYLEKEQDNLFIHAEGGNIEY